MGAIGVIAGAYGAHMGLSASDLDTWRTAVLYCLLHAGVGVAVSLNLGKLDRLGWLSSLAFLLGILGFSGSILFRIFTGNSLGPIAPIGGSLLILGWVFLAAAGVLRRI